MLHMMLGSQGELVLKSAFTGWNEHVSLLKQEREIEKLKCGRKEKGQKSTKRMLAMLMGSQADVVKKATFASWREHLVEVKQQNDVDQIQQSLKAKGAETSKRMLGMLLGSQ